MKSRAFALPLVILLTLVVSLAVGVLMQRNSMAYLAARRQADGYISHHAGLGMREMVSRWLTTVRGRLQESIEENGFAFSLDLPGGDRIEVFMEDAQGSALARGDALVGRRREIVELMNIYLEAIEQAEAGDGRPGPGNRAGRSRSRDEGAERREDGSRRLPLRRMHGPSEISIKTAPREVLEALAAAITDPKKAAEVADALVQRREREAGSRELPVDEVTRTLREVGLKEEELHEFNTMLVYEPRLYRVIAEVWSGNRLLERAGGLIEVTDSRGDPFNQNGPFLTWESLPLDDGYAPLGVER